jgi:hypothetical protein
MTPLKQKTKDRLIVIGLLALESGLIYDSIVNFYQYALLRTAYYLILAVLSTIGSAIFLVILMLLLVGYLEKRKVLISFKK